jgi:hypothetical protein
VPVDEVQKALDRVVPSYAGRNGDWEGVLQAARASAAPPERRWQRPLLVGLAVALAALLFWPGDDGERILERARAAVQGGPVVHLVLRAPSREVYDLRRGEYRRIPAEREQWFDPDRGLHEVQRVGGAVIDDVLYPAGPPEVEQQFTGLATAYRRALASDEASLGQAETVGGRRVHWIRFRVRYPDVGIPVIDEEHEVAVDAETFEPRFLRVDGGPVAAVLSWETLPRGRGDFTAARTEGETRSEVWSGASLVGVPTPTEARSALAGAVWLGPDFGGAQLAPIRELRFETGRFGQPAFESVRALELCYGPFPRCPVKVTQAAEPHPFAGRGHGWGEIPPPGTVALDDRVPVGWLVRDGAYVTIFAGSREQIIAAAEALAPIP